MGIIRTSVSPRKMTIFQALDVLFVLDITGPDPVFRHDTYIINISLTLARVGGGWMPPPPRFFINNSRKYQPIALKFWLPSC